MRGMAAATRVVELIDELKTKIGRAFLVVNRVDGELPPTLREAIAALSVEYLGTIPRDPALAALDAQGRPLVEIADDSAVYEAVKVVADKLGIT
jgi:CO dehydrogenase nickel-insertion accessory protein CooC1